MRRSSTEAAAVLTSVNRSTLSCRSATMENSRFETNWALIKRHCNYVFAEGDKRCQKR
jgi:hypothetical protein